jgi:hypothetical protein
MTLRGDTQHHINDIRKYSLYLLVNSVLIQHGDCAELPLPAAHALPLTMAM